MPAKLARVGNEIRLVVPPAETSSRGRRDPALIKLMIKAHAARAAVEAGTGQSIDELARAQGYERQYFSVLLKLSYLAPDLVKAIMDGQQAPEHMRQGLARMPSMPLCWQSQRTHLTTCA